MRKKAYKRRQYIVDTRFQYSLMSKFAILTACIVISSLSFLVLVYHKYGDIKVSVVQPIPFGLFDSLVDNGGVGTLSCRYDDFYFFLQPDCFSQNGRACLQDERSIE